MIGLRPHLNRLLLGLGVSLISMGPLEARAAEDLPGVVQVEGGSAWSGLLVDAEWEVVVRGDDGAERRIPKHSIQRLEGGDPVLWAEMAIARWLSNSGGERDAIRESIRSHESLTPEQLVEAAQRPPRRAPIESGRSVRPVRIRGTELDTDYVLVVPPGYDPTRAWPLWISMHGTGGRGADCAQFLQSLANERGFLLACPTEHPNQHGKGWGYSDAERDLTVSVLDDVKRTFHVDTDKVYLNGWSRGGHASYDVADHYPGLFAGINPVIGAPQSRYFGLLRNLSVMGITIVNGALDDSLLVFAARQGVETLRKHVSATVEYDEDPDRGHVLFLDRMPGVAAYLLERSRDPEPDEILLAGYDSRYARLAWLRLDAFDDEAYSPGKPVRVKGIRDSWSDERKLGGFQKAVFGSTAWAKATRQDDRFTVKSEGVTRLAIRVPVSYGGSKKIRIKANKKTVFNEVVERDVSFLLADLDAHRDRRQLYWNEIVVDVR